MCKLGACARSFNSGISLPYMKDMASPQTCLDVTHKFPKEVRLWMTHAHDLIPAHDVDEEGCRRCGRVCTVLVACLQNNRIDDIANSMSLGL
jgi:hypothetical protein